MILPILQALVCVAAPAAAMWAVRKSKLLAALGPVVLCYSLGLLMANFPGLSLDFEVSKTLSEAAVPLAIPLLLFSTHLGKTIKLASRTLLSFGLACISVCASAYLIGPLFADKTDEYWKISGMLVGVYTGGTPNMSAIGLALKVKDETFILLNTADVVTGGIYLLLLLSVAKPVLAKLLPAFEGVGGDGLPPAIPAGEPSKDRPSPKAYALGLGASVLVVGISAGSSLLFFGDLKVTYVLLMLTTLGLLGALWRPLHTLEGSFALGEYILLIFCVAVGSMADLSTLTSASLMLFSFLLAVMSASILSHLLLSFVFRVDVDTVIIASTAALYGPPFIGPVAQALGNRELVAPGLAIGLLGLALGNYLGLGIAFALQP